MAILLDEATRAEYIAQSLASSRASLVVSALTGTVVVEVYDGANVLRASGTMASPWATASGSTITIGEVNAAGLSITTGGAPDSLWYCQFRGSNGRFVRGTFGLSGSGADFTWSLSSFQTGSRGTIGTATFTTVGVPEIVTAPSITGTPQVNQTLTVSTGTWLGSPTLYIPRWQRSANGSTGWADINAAGGLAYSAQLADQGQYLRAGVGALNEYGASATSYSAAVGPVAAAAATIGPTITAAPSISGTAQIGATVRIAYPTAVSANGTTYPTFRQQWKLDGVAVANEIGGYYNIPPSAVGKSLTCTVTVYDKDPVTNLEGNSTSVTTAPVVITTRALDSQLAWSKDFQWIGTFRLPQIGMPEDGLYGGYALAFDPSGSLFIAGKTDGNKVAQVTIPSDALLTTSGRSSNLDSLPVSTFLQPYADPLGGASGTAQEYWLMQQNYTTAQGDSNGRDMPGLLVYGGALHMSYISMYDAANLQYYSHAKRSGTSLNSGALSGPYSFAPQTVGGVSTDRRWYGGAMGHVPSALQSTLGGPVIQTNSQRSIMATQSDGPFLSTFNPANYSVSSTPSTILAGYEIGDLEGPYANGVSPDLRKSVRWHTGFTGSIRGLAVPTGGRCVLCIGTAGIGPRDYGTEGFAAGKSEWKIVNPTGPYGQGEHSFPYRTVVLAYDINDLAAVKAGSIAPNAVRPYAYWFLRRNTFENLNGPYHGVGAFDIATNRLYLSRVNEDNGWLPLIDVYQINLGS